MTVAHVVGIPFEELLAPLLVAGSGFVVALRVRLGLHRQSYETRRGAATRR